MQCSNGTAIPTQATITIKDNKGNNTSITGPKSTDSAIPDSQKNQSAPNVTAGSTISTVGTSFKAVKNNNQCWDGSSFNSAQSGIGSNNPDSPKQILALTNGQKAPSTYQPYKGQQSIKDYLKAANVVNSQGVVTIGSNDVIFLYELGTTDAKQSYYDLQDALVLITITRK
jgi:hypothetical protein